MTKSSSFVFLLLYRLHIRMAYNRLHENNPIDSKSEPLIQRLDRLENEVHRLKDQQIKSKIYIKELEDKVTNLSAVVQNLTEPKQNLAAPFTFGSKQKRKNLLKKSNSEDFRSDDQHEINYDHILSSKHSSSRERLGLFGSLGATSQNRQ